MITKNLFIKLIRQNFRFTLGDYTLAASKSPEQQARDYGMAANFAYNDFVVGDISNWTATDFINFICKTHAKLAGNLLDTPEIEMTQFREVDLLVLRNSEKIGHINDFQPMFALLHEKFPDKIKSFAIAYYKWFYNGNSTIDAARRERNLNAIIALLKRDFKVLAQRNEFESKDLTQDEKDAFNIVYRVYPEAKELDLRMEVLANKILPDILANSPEVAAIFFHEFLQIKPFSDGNGRLARLIAGAIMAKQGLPILNLSKPEARKHYEHAIAYNPKQENITEMFKTMQQQHSLPTLAELTNALGQQFLTKYGEAKWSIKSIGNGYYDNKAVLISRQIPISALEQSKKWFENKFANMQVELRFDEVAGCHPKRYKLAILGVAPTPPVLTQEPTPIAIHF